MEVSSYTLSQTIGEGTPAWIGRYALLCARHADPESTFGRLFSPHAKRADKDLLRMLLFTGYDGFILAIGKEVVGHAWFQRREDELRVFDVWVIQKHRRRLREKIILEVLARARAMEGVGRVRFGSDMQARAVSWVINWLQRKHGPLGIESHSGGVVVLKKRAEPVCVVRG